MFASTVFATVLASSALLVSAIVEPNEPGPGDIFNQGAKCNVGWAGDDSGTDAWKDMAIELMTGPNEKMIHLTTVAQHQDGSVTGTFNYDCPQVTPNSPIYFYQFTAAGTANFTWTGRFSIATTAGATTPAQLTEQSNGQTVAYGNGALVDPSTAVAAPTFNSTTSGSSSSSSPSSGSSVSPSAPSAPSSGFSTSAASHTASGAAPSNSNAAANSNSSSPSGSAPAGQASGGASAAIAVGPIALNRVLPFVAALTASALGFTILL
ncbi:hypothetical protein C8F04DRAFT_954801 [Mycena alexandri]|uniref:Ser-Thr-rich glycosyl-phosphatidyl-inositol-anchored membrane family-domain-containing protein n=1 Tax=Mycena alexandri TaxID=1745969 RepID=A0AAD6X4S1_9AGAR|nr:hypothetical protein C8F04DRAFT_954801 [Mycena alexandri]